VKTNHSLFLILSVLIALALASCGASAPAPAAIAAVPAPDLANATVNASFGVPGDGNVLPLGLLDTCRYLIQVVQGLPSTFIMTSPQGQYFLAWSMQGDTWGFLALNANGAPLTSLEQMTGSNMANTTSFADLVKALEQNGWTYTTPALLPAWLTTTLGTASAFVIRYGEILASPMPMFIIMPGGNFVDPGYAGKN
jgi:hypothetical protein